MRRELSLLCLLGFLGGCSDVNKTVFVDFSVRSIVPAVQAVPESSQKLSVAVAAMVSPKESLRHYRQLLNYVSRHMARNVLLVQKKTYGQLSRLFEQAEVDLAFVCTGSYVLHRNRTQWELLAAPQIMGRTTYHSYLIVHKDAPFETLDDLHHKTFAITDPHSNTGRLVPTAWVIEKGFLPEEFFSEIIYTYSHDNSILAVAKALWTVPLWIAWSGNMSTLEIPCGLPRQESFAAPNPMESHPWSSPESFPLKTKKSCAAYSSPCTRTPKGEAFWRPCA